MVIDEGGRKPKSVITSGRSSDLLKLKVCLLPILFCSVLFCSILLYFIILYFISFYLTSLSCFIFVFIFVFEFFKFYFVLFFIFLAFDIQASRGDLEALTVAVYDDKTLTLRMYVHDIYKYIKV